VLTTAAARSTYHVAYTRILSSGLLLLYRRRKRFPSPSRLSSRLSNCLSCSVSSLFNALPSLETLGSPPGGILHSYLHPRCPLDAVHMPLVAGSMQGGTVGPGAIGPGRSATFEASPTRGMPMIPARFSHSFSKQQRVTFLLGSGPGLRAR
jgi:hypothetical protein